MKTQLLNLLFSVLVLSTNLFPQEYLFFTDSDNSSYYDPSWLSKTAPSELLIVNSTKFPVDASNHHSGVNSLKLQWTSKAGGDWASAIASPGWVGWDVTIMDSISFWIYSTEIISDSVLPKIYLEDLSNQKTEKINLDGYYGEIPDSTWINIKVPVQIFLDNSGNADLTKIKTVFFGQSVNDAQQHTVFIDDLKFERHQSGSDNKLIVVLGSSTDAGIGANPSDSAWVNRFRNNLTLIDNSFIVFNLAVGGYSTYDVMPTGFVPPAGRPFPKVNNNITYALQFNPVMIIVNLPTNDAAYNYSISETITNFDSIISTSHLENVNIYLTTPQPRNFSNQSQLNLLFDLLDSCYSRYSSIYIDFWNGLAQPNGFILPQFNSGDGVHLNNAGHRIIFERAADKLFPILVDVDEMEFLNVKTFDLEQNYPNPFNPETVISYSLATDNFVTLKIFDVLGNELMTIINGFQTAGFHKTVIRMDSFNYSTGVYFYQLNAGNLFETKKMIYLK